MKNNKNKWKQCKEIPLRGETREVRVHIGNPPAFVFVLQQHVSSGKMFCLACEGKEKKKANGGIP